MGDTRKLRRILVVSGVAIALASAAYLFLISKEERVFAEPVVNASNEHPTPSVSVEEPTVASNSSIGSVLNGMHVGHVQVEFPNGAAVVVSLVQFVPPMPTVPTGGVLAEDYDRLANAAENGDAAAARWLFRGLRSCVGGFLDLEKMNSSIAEMHKTGHLTYPDGKVQDVGIGQQAVWSEEVLRDQFQSCDGLSNDQINSRAAWLELAATEGDFLAMRDYAVTELGLETPEGFDMYKKTWDAGHLGSASAMAILYRNGAPGELNGQPDRLTSYAYTLLSHSVYKAISKSGDNVNGLSPRPLSANRLHSMDQLLSQKGAYLTPAEVKEAEHLAVSLLLDNKACCLGNWLSQ